jgi:hypothetical protein
MRMKIMKALAITVLAILVALPLLNRRKPELAGVSAEATDRASDQDRRYDIEDFVM